MITNPKDCLNSTNALAGALTDRIQKQRGIGLIELLLSISIIAVIIIGAIALYSSVSESNKVQKMAKDHLVITTAIRSIFAQSSSYSGLDAMNLGRTGLLPQSMFDSTGFLNTPYGCCIWVNSYLVGARSGFVLQYPGQGMPTTVCVKFTSLLLQADTQIKILTDTIATVNDAIRVCELASEDGTLAEDIFMRQR